MTKENLNIGTKRVQRISKNFFLHIHSAKIHPDALKPTYTFGLGLILAFLFLTMIVTGIILMMNYTPMVEKAYDSVKDIVFIIPGGRYIRNIHRWAAHGMVLVVFLHLIRTFLTGTYFEGRKQNWIIGVCMMVVVLFMSFSGYLLPWDQLAYWAVTIGSNIAASPRELTDMLGITNFFDIGGFFKKLLIGGESVGQPALTRFFMFHVVFLPLTLMVLTGWHIWRIRKDGGLAITMVYKSASTQVNQSTSTRAYKSASPRVHEYEQRLYSWPVLMWTELTVLLVVAVVLLIMASLFEAPLREQANPLFSENPAKSPWYFLGIQELVSYSAFAGGVIIPLLFIVFLISIPYVDKEGKYSGIWFSGKEGKKVMIFSILFSVAVSVLLIFIIVRYGWLREWFDDVSGSVIMMVNPATISALIYIIWSVLVKRKTGSTRMAAIALFTCAIIGLIIYTVTGIWFRGPDWEFFWTPSYWPVQ